MIIPENTQSLPANLALGLALVDFANESGIQVINHMHDFYFERIWFQADESSNLRKLYRHLVTGFNIQTPVVINTEQKEKLVKQGLFKEEDIFVVPNLRKFENKPSHTTEEKEMIDALKNKIRGQDTDAIILGSMVRPVKRKNLILAVKIAARVSKLTGKKVK